MNNNEIRSKLQQGHTIDEVCKTYHLTFKELVTFLSKHQKINKTKHRPKRYLYISQVGGRWIIRRAGVHFGTYSCLSDAMKVRDWFMFRRWDKRNLERACRETGVVRCRYKKNGKWSDFE